jgi:hypothetical protein
MLASLLTLRLEPTSLGLAIIALGSAMLIGRREWLLALLIVCAVLQAPAALIVHAGTQVMGVTPFNLASLFVGAGLAIELFDRDSRLALGRIAGTAYVPWLAFFLFSAATAVLLPLLFDGVPVFPLYQKGEIARVPVANGLSISHFAQAISNLALAVCFAFAALSGARRGLSRVFAAGFAVALLATLAAGVYQRGAIFDWWRLADEFWGSNPSYNQYYTSPFGPYFGRVALPFIEPSYASVWFACIAAAATAVFVCLPLRRSWPALLVLLLALAGLLNTLGTSGMVAYLLALPLIALLRSRLRPAAEAASAQGAQGLVLAALAVAIVSCVVADYLWWQTDALYPVRVSLDFTWLKISWLADGPRVWSNLRALEIFAETYGLGAGAGSTRASSYFLSLLANTGIAGFALFAWGVARQWRAVWTGATSANLAGLAVFGATAACLIGVGGAIPDQSWPVLWMILLAGASLCGTPKTRLDTETSIHER